MHAVVVKNKVKEKLPASENDQAWKILIDAHFPQLIAFFYPHLYEQIDWSRGYKSLDKELEKIMRKAIVGNRLVDKLIQVYSYEGTQAIVLCHLEIQGKQQSKFSRRLFEYYCRLYLKYQQAIITLVILIDNSPNWRPKCYQSKVWGLPVIQFYFYAIKLLDYRGTEQILAESNNPFAWVVLVQLAAMETQQDPDNRLAKKFTLTRYLYQRNYSRETIIELYTFIDWVLTLPQGLENRYDEQIRQFEEENDMNYITRIEQQGIQQGIQQGVQQGECALLLHLMQCKFQQVPEYYAAKVKQASSENLIRWSEAIFEATTLAEVFAEA